MPRKSKRNTFYVICTIIAPIVGLAVGWLYKPDEFSDIGKLWLFIGAFVAFAVSNLFSGLNLLKGADK